MDFLNIKIKVKRLLLNALDEKSINTALNALYDNQKFENLKKSADTRQRLDWMLGMNASRYYTLTAEKKGYRTLFTVGRVQTPTLSIIIHREEEIKTFKPLTYYIISAIFNTLSKETFLAKLKPNPDQKGIDESNRLIDPIAAREILVKVNTSDRIGQIVKYDVSQKQEPHPLGYSLSALQIQASKKYGLKPQETLNIVQDLYEQKFLTYPRSDCNHLPENQHAAGDTILNNLKITGHKELRLWAEAADPTIKSRIWNDKKISAHHAIIPTETTCNIEKLSENQQKIYILIAISYISQFFPLYRYHQTDIEIDCAGVIFTTSGRTISQLGWKLLYEAEKNDPYEDTNCSKKSLPPLSEGATVYLFTLASLVDKKTEPPQRFTEGTLLAAMKDIYKFLHDKSLKDTIKSIGIGTEATRASIINNLIVKKYLTIDKKTKHLLPTVDALLLFDMLSPKLIYPDYTAIMEQKLELIATGQADPNEVIQDQLESIKELLSSRCTTFKLPDNRICQCTGILNKKKGSKGFFWGCSNYPTCKNSYPDKNGEPDTAPKKMIPCPICKKGSLTLRKIHNFWGCSNWKEGCKAAFDDIKGKPYIELCPQCQSDYLRKFTDKDGSFWKCRACQHTFDDLKGQPKLTN